MFVHKLIPFIYKSSECRIFTVVRLPFFPHAGGLCSARHFRPKCKVECQRVGKSVDFGYGTWDYYILLEMQRNNPKENVIWLIYVRSQQKKILSLPLSRYAAHCKEILYPQAEPLLNLQQTKFDGRTICLLWHLHGRLSNWDYGKCSGTTSLRCLSFLLMTRATIDWLAVLIYKTIDFIIGWIRIFLFKAIMHTAI